MTYNVAMGTWHDGSIACVKDGELQFLLESERYSHVKHGFVCDKTMKEFKKQEVKNIKTIDLTGLSGQGKDSSHHLYHAYQAFYDSGFKEAVCVIIDGMGSEISLESPHFQKGSYGRECISIYKLSYPVKAELIHRIISTPFICDVIHENNSQVMQVISPGLMFQKTCENWGMNWYDSGKLMAMAAYSNEDVDYKFNEIFKINDQDIRDVKLKKEFKSFQEKANYCKWLQEYCQSWVRKIIVQSIELSNCKNVVLSGGYFLNCVSNSYVRKNISSKIKIFIEPICGDDGVPIGLAKCRSYDNSKSKKINPLKSVYYGIDRKIKVDGKKINVKQVAKLISQKKVVAIFQGRSECGPRALGNRSILYDPRDPDGREKINNLKGREQYRPLAGTVLYEHAHKWFDMTFIDESPFMLYNLDVLSDKIPAISHVDNTCRVQTLKKSFNKNFYNLIKEFYNITDVPVLLNTSFNLAGDTIVETVEDAIKTYDCSDIDYIYFPESGVII
tara:strand:- start:6075 stop:7580 length:1506 start_codon:yes stop_codon:yes gene_type:complete